MPPVTHCLLVLFQILMPILNGSFPSATSYLWHETFEGSTACGWGGYTNCDSAPFFGSGATANYATAPAPLQGSFSLLIANSSDQLVNTITASNSVYAAVEFNFSALPSADVTILNVEDSSGNVLCGLNTFSNNFVLSTNTGGGNADVSVTMSTGTTYYAKVFAQVGTGANATCTAYFSTGGSSWSSATSTNGTWTAQIGRIAFIGVATQTNIFDDIRVATSDINYP